MQVGSVAGYDAYISEPSAKADKAVVLLSDIFGWATQNIRIAADKFADAGNETHSINLQDGVQGVFKSTVIILLMLCTQGSWSWYLISSGLLPTYLP